MSENEDIIKDIKKAIKEIKREALKASIIHGIVESCIILIILLLGFSHFSPGWIPEWSINLNKILKFSGQDLVLTGKIIIALSLSLLFFIVNVGISYRRSTVERFESFNPEIKEALRTARDISEDDEDHIMARNLYKDVLERLESTSSEGFIRLKRTFSLFLFIGLIAILIGSGSFLNSQFGLSSDILSTQGGGGSGGDSGPGASASENQINYQGLQNPDKVLGKESEVSSGSENINLGLDKSGSGENGGSSGGFGEGELSSGDTNVEFQRSGYNSEEEIEDSELVREYNLRIR